MSSPRSLPFPGSSKYDRSRSNLGIASCLPRRLKVTLAFAIIPTFLWFFYIWKTNDTRSASSFIPHGKPPNYYTWHQREKAMPQNSPDLPPPQGKHGKYLRFNNHLTTVGWGNSMQEMVMNAHLAWKSRRTYVMYNYTWDRHADGDYSHFGDTLIPARIPITAIAAGPIAGGPFPPSDPTPPAITTEFFEQVCPHPTLVNVQETKGDELEWASAATLMEGFSAKLRSIEDNCIELQQDTNQVFDFWIFGDGPRMMDFWPEITQSPILTEWVWSPLVVSGVEANRKKVHPAITKNDRHRAPLPGLIALHIRRGDFEGHCEHLAKWKSAYNAFNVRPDFPDQYVPPEGGGAGDNTPEGFAFYKKHCFPDIDQIVEKVMDVRTESKTPLDRIFILTNAKRDWLDELKSKFRAKAAWKSIATSRDLEVTWEQKFVAQSMDMLIATRAEVFVGNGWSSLTSNVNMLRISQLHPSSKSRFW